MYTGLLDPEEWQGLRRSKWGVLWGLMWPSSLGLVLQLLRQHQESEAVARRSLQKVQEEKRLFQERLSSLQTALAQIESEKREAERTSRRLEKDKIALRKTLDKVRPLWMVCGLSGRVGAFLGEEGSGGLQPFYKAIRLEAGWSKGK